MGIGEVLTEILELPFFALGKGLLNVIYYLDDLCQSLELYPRLLDVVVEKMADHDTVFDLHN